MVDSNSPRSSLEVSQSNGEAMQPEGNSAPPGAERLLAENPGPQSDQPPLEERPSTNPSTAGHTEPAAPSPARHSGIGRTVFRLTLGGFLLAIDTLASWRRQGQTTEGQPDPAQPQTERMPVPGTDWISVLGETDQNRSRFLFIGVISEANSGLNKGGQILWQLATTTTAVMTIALEPIYTSRLFTPVRDRLQVFQARGQVEADRLIAEGRRQEAQNRALAESAINQILDDSMNRLIEDPGFQLFVHEIVRAQSDGLIEATIEEIRARTVTGDTILENIAREKLGRPPRYALPPPPFQIQIGHQTRRQTTGPNLEGHFAGFTGRFLAFAIDMLIINIFLGLALWFITTVFELFNLDSFFAAVGSNSNTWSLIKTIAASSFLTLTYIGYLLLSWILMGQTIGKLFMGLRVVDPNGGYISFWRAMRRIIGYFLAALPLFAGFWWILIDDRRQGWHDKFSDTYVVYAWAAQTDETFLRNRN